MKVIFCAPTLTLDDTNVEKAANFMAACKEEMDNYQIETFVIRKEGFLSKHQAELTSEELIIYFTRSDDQYSEPFVSFLKKAVFIKAVIWPVALEKESRMPAAPTDKVQSFDVPWHLENRSLKEDHIKTVALIFARRVISYILPTLYNDHCLFFVSHRRLDGEDITACLCDRICLLAKRAKTFRDVVEVQVGEEAQELIEQALAYSDILIFLQTPKASESKWIKKEIKYAMLHQIPVLWIRIDNADIDKLDIRPSEKPHLSYKSKDFMNDKKLEEIANTVEEKCFELLMNHSQAVYDHINIFEQFADTYHIDFKNVSQKELIYRLSYSENKIGFYPKKEFIQYVQYYSRKPGKEDETNFKAILNEVAAICGDQDYDSAVILTRYDAYQEREQFFLRNNFDDHIKKWEQEVGIVKGLKGKRIVISGAFPEEEELTKQPLTEAVRLFAQEIIGAGYQLVFGAHPTFQGMLFAVGEEYSTTPTESVHMYISKRYISYYEMEELNRHATIYVTDLGRDDRESLTILREQMIGDGDNTALVCIGGKIKKDPALQGVDEEVTIARKHKLPVFLIGSVGGRSSQMALERERENDWNKINEAGKKFNEALLYEMDYRKLARQMIRMLEENV